MYIWSDAPSIRQTANARIDIRAKDFSHRSRIKKRIGIMPLADSNVWLGMLQTNPDFIATGDKPLDLGVICQRVTPVGVTRTTRPIRLAFEFSFRCRRRRRTYSAT